MKHIRTTRRASLAVLAGLAVTGVVGASAASLGGLNVGSLGAGDADVSSCNDDGVDIDFEVTLAGATYVVEEVVVSDVDAACDGLVYELTLFDDADAVLATESGTAAGGSFTVPIGDQPEAEAVAHVALVISG